MPRVPIAIVTMVVLTAAAPCARATEHLVTDEIRNVRLAAAAAQRQRDQAAIGHAVAAAAAVGLDVDAARLRAALAVLTDGELRDLAARAAAADRDPVAGADPLRVVLITLAVLAVVLYVAALLIAESIN